MGTTAITTAAPNMFSRGVRDASGTVATSAEINRATHVTLVYGYAQRGPKRRLVNGSDASRIFGSETFDPRKPYATHATELAKIVLGAGSSIMFHRVLPNDVGPRSNRALWIDVLPTEVTQYERDANGSLVFSQLGERVELKDAQGNVVKLPGFKVKFTVDNIDALSDEAKFGRLEPKVGTMTEGAVQSIKTPLIQWWASSHGQLFNNSGARIFAPTDKSLVPLDKLAMVSTGCYPNRLAVITRTTSSETARPVETMTGEQFIDFALPDAIINGNTNQQYSLDDVYQTNFRHVRNDGDPYVEGEFEKFHAYTAYLPALLEKFYAAEKDHGSADSDFKSVTFANVEDKKFLFNILGGCSSNGEEYRTYVVDTESADAVRLSETTNLFAQGGYDGTMWEAAMPLEIPPRTNAGSFADLVSQQVADYANPNSNLLNTAVNIESILYDSGFPLETKREMCKFISERKDTFLVLSPYEVHGSHLTAVTENSRAALLRDYARIYAESDYFGTQTMRALIFGRHGKLVGSSYRHHLPLTLELAGKAAAMMGAADGRWREGAIFDRYPNNIVKMFEDVNVTYTPPSTRNRDWKQGLNWVQSFSQTELFIPGLQTIYDDDTSVLNSFFVAMCCVTLQRIGEQVWRKLSGSVRLTDEQLLEAANSEVNTEVQERGRFCDMFRIVPKAKMTPADRQRGYSWTLDIELYAGVMKTVMTLDVSARRNTEAAAA